MELVTAEEMREMDQRTITSFGIPGVVLMENAGRGATRVLMEQFGDLENKKVGILAGSGNNGGDGFVIARYLFLKGVRPTVFLLTQKEKVKGDAALNLSLLAPLNIEVCEVTDTAAFQEKKADMAHQHLYVDAILGTGLNSDVRGHYKDVIAFVNEQKKNVLSVDIPSGINSNTGQVCGISINADVTVTFAFAKPGHVVFPGAQYAGKIEIIDIGIPHHIRDDVKPNHFLITDQLVRKTFPVRAPETHKGHTGHLLIIAGSPGKTGAAALTSMAALRTGAGLVTLGCPKNLNPVLESLITEGMTYPLPETKNGNLSELSFDAILNLMADKKCIAIGPGIGTDPSTKKLVRKLVEESRITMVIDADGLNCLSGHVDILKTASIPVIMTPHPGEMARLMGTDVNTIQKNRIAIAREFASTYHVYLVLKGAKTIIAHPDGRVWINQTGNPGMASAGMGDVLTGMIAGLVAQGLSPEDAAVSAVYLHGKTSDTLSEEIGPVGYLASDIVKTIPEQIRRMLALHDNENRTVFSKRLFKTRQTIDII
ncbi:MAG: NAD(P)H-hydrate dehydratase [Proteobacteria bacterium]|nr:NAD(P)H-hydrate dehydratase [Pseudomonadota bacterium]